MKKVTGGLAKQHYENIDESTGEIKKILPEYTTMSRRPGIAAGWLEKWQSDVYPSDTLVIKGRVMRPPKYYDNIFKIDNEIKLKEIKEKRKNHMRKHNNDILPSRLKTRETVKLAQLKQLKRNI